MTTNPGIMYTTCYLDVSGVTKINFDILKLLKESGLDIHICVTDDDTHLNNNWDLLFHLHINKPLKLRKSRGNLFDAFSEYLEENHILCIYNTHSLWIYEHSGMLKKRFPYLKIIDSLHVMEPFCFRGGYPDISANRHIHHNIDRSIMISDDLKNHVINNYVVDQTKIYVVRNGIDTIKFRKKECYKDKFKKELGLKCEEKLIGFVGRLTPQKRPLLFLETALKIVKKERDCYFYMIGDGELRSKTAQFVFENKMGNRIFHFGHRDDIDSIFNSTDILLQPSSYEGAPLTILEALSTGVSVISSDVGAIREYVGQCSKLIPPVKNNNESELFYDAILKELDSPSDSGKSCSYVHERYDIRQVSQQYKQIIMECIGLHT